MKDANEMSWFEWDWLMNKLSMPIEKVEVTADERDAITFADAAGRDEVDRLMEGAGKPRERGKGRK